jgi:hypothetical protein
MAKDITELRDELRARGVELTPELIRSSVVPIGDNETKSPPFAERLEREFGKNASSPEEQPERLSGRNILDFLDIPIDPKTNFLANRLLTAGSGMFVIAPSNHGKSSLSIQFLISFAIGRAAFAIRPPRALRILCIQSEDDDAETKKFAQVIRKMNLTGRELELLKENTRFEYRNDLTGLKFLEALESFLSEWPADLCIINPLTGFLLSDLKDEEKVASFLRGRLNPILSKYRCAAIIIHHTPKTNFKKVAEMEWYDWMYAMAGCATLTNWARAVLVLAPSKVPGTYRLIAAKRFDEIQWTEREYWFSHSRETIALDGQSIDVISWVPASDVQISAAKPVSKTKKEIPALEEVWQKMSPLEEYTRRGFQDWCGKQFSLGVNKSWDILKGLCEDGLVQALEEERPKTNPLKRYRKVRQPASGQ